MDDAREGGLLERDRRTPCGPLEEVPRHVPSVPRPHARRGLKSLGRGARAALLLPDHTSSDPHQRNTPNALRSALRQPVMIR